jgi:hypothetical protein
MLSAVDILTGLAFPVGSDDDGDESLTTATSPEPGRA